MKRRGASLIVQIHGWRGIGLARDLFIVEVCLGFISIGGCRYCLNDRLALLVAELVKLRELVRAQSARSRDGGGE
ncbi:MAG: hypothetical protein AB7P02_05205 [Alphaproteobacteria bacterium]